MAESPATTFSLIEEGGVTLHLRDRALPYRPLTITGKQRAEFTWYPGNPEATVQMLGPEEGAIQIQGYWKDRFIQGTGAAQLVSSGQEGVAGVAFSLGDITTFGVSTVAALVQAVDNMRRMGRRITLSWAGLQRVGHITSFTQTWHNAHDCEWQLDFAVLSQGEGTVPTVTADVPNLADQAFEALQNAQNVKDAAVEANDQLATTSLTLRAAASKILDEFDTATTTAANAIYNSVSSVATYQQLPFDIARRIAASTSGLVTSASQTIGTALDRALSDVVEFGAWGTQDTAPMGIQVAGNSVQRSYESAVRSVMYNNAISRYSIETQLQQDLKASFIATQNQDLRDVSTRYYGTPDNWREIMQFNGFASSKLTAGTLVWVPQQASQGGPAGRADSRSY